MMPLYFSIYKPFRVLSQFSPVPGKETLSDYFDLPKDVYPVGRLDYDSEGLLILTNDKTLNNHLLNPAHQHEREYWVQVEKVITEEAIVRLAQGVEISVDGKKIKTLPAKVMMFDTPPALPERNPPIRSRKNIPTCWIRLILHEGKNRQVRRMTAAVGFPTLRLLRVRIENINLGALKPGERETIEPALIKELFSSKR